MRHDDLIVTTGNEVSGRQIVTYLGIVRGVAVRRPITILMWNPLMWNPSSLEAYANACQQAREKAYERMVDHAWQLGANAVIGVRYDASELGQITTEIVAYGTAVKVE